MSGVGRLALIRSFVLIEHLYLRGAWLDATRKIGKEQVSRRDMLHSKPNNQCNRKDQTIQRARESSSLFDNEQDIHLYDSKNHASNPSTQCLRLKSSMPFKRGSALQTTPLSKQPFKMQPQIENEDVT